MYAIADDTSTSRKYMTDIEGNLVLGWTFSRRQFIGALAAAGAGTCWARGVPGEEPLLRIGVMSDSHVTADSATLEPLRREFSYMAAQNVDVVMHAGDICDNGTLDELEMMMGTWRECFRDGRNAAGLTVVPFFVFGNHDYRTTGQKANLIFHNKEKAWQMICGEPFPGEVFSKTVKGFTFVGAHWRSEGSIGEWFKAHPAPKGLPIFHVQHPHPWHTCFGDWAPCEKAGFDELLRHPNLFSCSGHSHISIGDDRALWQGGFVSLGAGSARCPSHGRRKEYENGAPKLPWPDGEYRHMPSARSGKGWQASIIEVRRDGLTIVRREFYNGESMGSDWHVPFPFRHDASRPYILADAAAAPEFPADATVVVTETEGKRRPDGAIVKLVRVRTPAACGAAPGSRVLAYRFTVIEAATGKVILERRALHDCITVSEIRARRMPCWCAFARTDLPAGMPLKVRVEPLNASLRAGRPIESAEFTLS